MERKRLETLSPFWRQRRKQAQYQEGSAWDGARWGPPLWWPALARPLAWMSHMSPARVKRPLRLAGRLPQMFPVHPGLNVYVVLASHWILRTSVSPWSYLLSVPINFSEHVYTLGPLRRTLRLPVEASSQKRSLALPRASSRTLHTMLNPSKSLPTKQGKE